MATGSHQGGLTTIEMRLVEQYVSVLDYISRCAQAIDHGDWFYLHDKAGHLADQAERLSAIAREAYDARRRLRVPAVRAAVAWFGRHYRAARLLHPLDPDPPGGSPEGVGDGEAAPARHPGRGRHRPAPADRLLRAGRPVPPLPGSAAEPAGPGLPRPPPSRPASPRRPPGGRRPPQGGPDA